MEPKDGLTQDESASIYLYAMEWNETENSLYAILNRTLCLADRTQLRPWFRYLKLFLTALFKLPSIPCRVFWRGVPEDLSTLYSLRKEQIWWSFSSWTSSISVLESPFYLGKSKARTMMSIETKNGKLIRTHSFFQNHDEILLPPGICLRVIDQANPTDSLHFIHFQEISPPFPMLAEPFDLNQLKKTPPKLLSSQGNFPKVDASSNMSLSSSFKKGNSIYQYQSNVYRLLGKRCF
ncbi:unnamed protein product [Rotaria sordida]|uniref:NAD(P)(+)--arginine ADP-ribosyltransferase n=1 Tax=Rotaria sordida TaxID=392033 RepID=A0A819E1L7_9BILA|nr:unnamed protein product [Rotaria sordida]CAF1231344.1 unnamed protein product [Rotaria sordida]CAF3842900.1 unnamed protein product [Rotaria sordida]CAF3933190.1 unnamed protein product [Rotaria sordida]